MPSPPLPSCAPFKCVRRVALLHVDRLVVRRERGLLDCFAERRMAVTRSRYVLARGAVFHRQNTLRCYVSGGERGGEEEEEGRRGGGGKGRRGRGVREREERKQWRSRHYFEFFPPQNRRNVPISSPAFGPMMCAPRILSVSACAMNFTTPSASSEARARLLAMNANFPVL